MPFRGIGSLSSLAEMLAARSKAVLGVAISGAGRGLVAAEDIPAGTVVHSEQPMACTPAPAALDSACGSCLLPITGPPPSPSSLPAAALSPPKWRFCSPECEQDAHESWLQADAASDFSKLREACADSGEKFPLIAARIACMMLQREAWPPAAAASGGVHGAKEEEQWALRGDAIRDMDSLCFPAMGDTPPAEWAQAYSLLADGLSARGGNRPVAAAKLDLQWFCWVMARIHLNAFRVDTVDVPALSRWSSDDPGALLRAAALFAGGDGERQGSAVYLLASLLNHSCEPNLDVTFRGNNAEVSFVAVADIQKHSELTISYIDVDLPWAARQEKLRFSYGFTCQCPRCKDKF